MTSLFKNEYILCYGHGNGEYKQCYGATIKQLKDEFHSLGNQYESAHIIDKNSNQIVDYYINASWQLTTPSGKGKKKRDDTERYTFTSDKGVTFWRGWRKWTKSFKKHNKR